MTVTLGSNILSLKAQSGLSRASSSLATSFERLSSGLRINNASDDAAGLSIASRLNSDARIFTQAVRNVNDGISAASIAEGALGALKSISERQLELAEEAANGSYSLKQRQVLSSEANKLVEEYNRIVSSTTFNGRSLLDRSLDSVLIQAGTGIANALSLGLSDQLKRAVGDGSFTPQTSFLINSDGSLLAADFNGDGLLDALTTGSGTTIVLGNSDGTFKLGPSLSLGYATTGDFNGDGKTDIAGEDYGGNIVTMLGNGDGTFRLGTAVATDVVVSMVSGDLNGDGRDDLVAYSQLDGYSDVYLMQADGTLSHRATLSIIPSLLVDVDGDGKADLTDGANILFSNGDGTFKSTQVLGSGAIAAVGDFNLDGIQDLIGIDGAVHFGNGNRTFASESFGSGFSSAATGDFNGDGKLDFVELSSNLAFVLTNNGDGTFRTMATFATTEDNLDAAAVGDFNGDGRADLLFMADTLVFGGGAHFEFALQELTANAGFTTTSQALNLSTQQGARDALGTVRGNLDRIENQLGSIGAAITRFQTAIATLQVQRENFTAAASRIQDADIASESANLTRESILQQAAAAVLVQANQQPSLALQLLH